MCSSITLCAVVRNEAKVIRSCLAKTFQFFDTVEITDTGSDDETVNILREEYGLESTYFPVHSANSYSILDARNYNIGLAKTDYICVLDGDETLSSGDVTEMRKVIESTNEPAGYFLHWITNAVGQEIKDYKLNLFKRHPLIRFQGARHPNVTRSIRDIGGYAIQNNAVIQHFPEQSKQEDKQRCYIMHLSDLVEMEPENFRYKWFLGMTLYSYGQSDEALPHLQACAASRSHNFPVECLNSHMLLAAALYESGRTQEASNIVMKALCFHTEVARDFEVRVNQRLMPTLHSMRRDIEYGVEKLRTYAFGR